MWLRLKLKLGSTKKGSEDTSSVVSLIDRVEFAQKVVDLLFGSELSRWVHLHERLDVGPVVVWGFAGVQARVLCSLVLVLVDVAVLVANSRRNIDVWNQLGN